MELRSPSQDTISIPQVRNLVRGQVIAPNDAAYDAARTVFMGDVDRRPAVIVRPADAADVSRVVSLARETGLELAVRSGGHSGAGHSVSEGGIVLDLANLRGLEIDVEARTAWAETGLTAGEYSVAAAEHGLATGFGDTGSVGIGGLTLGGGVGYLVRKHGLTIDDLLAADVVTADGKVLRADPESHPDLFWAIRGGGGNFGVATRLQVPAASGRHGHGRDARPAGDARGHPRVHRGGGGGAGGAVDDRERHARAADAVRARGAPRQARHPGVARARRRSRGR